MTAKKNMVCRTCKVEKTISEFPLKSIKRLDTRCRDCRIVYRRSKRSKKKAVKKSPYPITIDNTKEYENVFNKVAGLLATKRRAKPLSR